MAACSRSATLDAYEASICTPPGNPDGRVVASLYRVDEPGIRTGDAMTLAGWRRADGYAGLEPGKQLDYRLLPSLRVANVHWVKQDPSTSMIAGLLRPTLPTTPRNVTWLETPNPLPRVRMVTQVRQSRDPAADIAIICPDTTVLCEVPIALPPSKPGKAVLTSEQPGRLEIAVDCPAAQLLAVAESYHPGWHASIDGCPQEIYRINGDFMGCTVGPGKHRVELSFQPDSLQRGRLTSCLGLGMLCLCFLGCTIAVEKQIFRGSEIMNASALPSPPAETQRPMNKQKLVSIVLPVYNEAKVLPILTSRIAAVMTSCPMEYEIILVNDGSRDESPQILDQLAAASDRLRVVHLSRNFGHQAAVQAGLVHARGDAIVLMDSDMQDAPEAIPRFLAEWQAGFDVVYAIRTQRKEKRR